MMTAYCAVFSSLGRDRMTLLVASHACRPVLVLL